MLPDRSIPGSARVKSDKHEKLRDRRDQRCRRRPNSKRENDDVRVRKSRRRGTHRGASVGNRTEDQILPFRAPPAGKGKIRFRGTQSNQDGSERETGSSLGLAAEGCAVTPT